MSDQKDSPKPFLMHTKTFKKYTKEYEAKVVDYVREWAGAHEVISFHEDASIAKVTAREADIATLLSTLKERFNYVPPEMREDTKKDAKK